MMTIQRVLSFTFYVLVILSAAQAFVPHGASFSNRKLGSTTIKNENVFQQNRPLVTSGTSTGLNAIIDIVGVSPEPIHTAFSFATFGPQPFWLLLILLPKSEITKKIMGTMDIVLFFALVHFFIVSASIVQPDSTAPLLEFNDVFDPSGDPQAAFMNMVTNYPNFVSEEWSHVLTWDLFVGRWVWLDGLKRGIFTSHSVLFCNLIGPPGLLMHWITSLVVGKGFIGNQVEEGDDQDGSGELTQFGPY